MHNCTACVQTIPHRPAAETLFRGGRQKYVIVASYVMPLFEQLAIQDVKPGLIPSAQLTASRRRA